MAAMAQLLLLLVLVLVLVLLVVGDTLAHQLCCNMRSRAGVVLVLVQLLQQGHLTPPPHLLHTHHHTHIHPNIHTDPHTQGIWADRWVLQVL